jgi:hypothetical protein
MAKYQPKHKAPRKRRGNEYTQEIWVIALMLAATTLTLFMHYNNATHLVTLSWWPSIARVFGLFGLLWVVFAVLVAMFTIHNVERNSANARRRK